MTGFLAQLVNGLSLGGVYLLLVTGFNLVLLVARVIHVSYPHTVVLSMYAAWYGIRVTGGLIPAGILLALVTGVLVNAAMAPLFTRLSKRGTETDINSTMVLSLAAGLIIVEILAQHLNKGFPVSFSDVTAREVPSLRAGSFQLSLLHAVALLLALGITATLFLALYRSSWGRRARAIAEDPVAAAIAGVPLAATRRVSYLIGGVIAGASACILAALLGFASATLADTVAIKALAVSIIAGLGHLAGGIVIALILGILEALAQGYLGGTWANAVALVLLLLILLLRPKGIFGSRI